MKSKTVIIIYYQPPHIKNDNNQQQTAATFSGKTLINQHNGTKGPSNIVINKFIRLKLLAIFQVFMSAYKLYNVWFEQK